MEMLKIKMAKRMENSLKTVISHVVLGLCTFKRPIIFEKCLQNISSLKLPQNIQVELLIIDNDSNASAKQLVDSFRNKINMHIHYFVEEKRGLSNARNRLLTEAITLGASHIAMFDDDILLPENWLVNYVDYYNKNPEAVIITAASYSKFLKKPPKYIEKNDLFKCSTTKKTGSIRTTAASGNVFFPVTLINNLGLKFNSEYVFMGGEDGRFFETASRKGATIIWCNDCYNYELNGNDKITVSWILKRSFYNGYSAAQNKIKQTKNPAFKYIYSAKLFLSFTLNCLFTPFSIVLGKTVFINMLGYTAKALGRLNGALKTKPLNYYENVYGE